MQSELSAPRLPGFPIPGQGAEPAVPQGEALGFDPTFVGNARLPLPSLCTVRCTRKNQEPAFQYKSGNLEFLHQRNTLCYKTSLLVQPTCAQQEI